MEQMIFLNGKQVEVIAYFDFESTGNRYLIYGEPNNDTIIHLGIVTKKDDIFYVSNIEKSQSFLLKKFLTELMKKDLNTVKGYRYFNRLPELQDNFAYSGSQEIVLDREKKNILREFIREVNAHNGEILEKAKEEYYMQLVDEKAKERRIVIILVIILLIVLRLIAYMIINFIKG